jgi:S1/P1 Nuclease
LESLALLAVKRLRAILCILVAYVSEAHAYGPLGHEIVGGIADQLLAGKPAGAQISALIDGITLEKASVIADEIKAWDEKGPDDTNQFPRYSGHPKVDKQLRDFWQANPPTNDPNSAVPSHHWFHYTDVPVFGQAKYSDGKVGRSKWDVVHMIPYCINVLRGETPEANERKITKPIAVILLAHYVGDIHQPLHVGAEYFNESGQAVDPDRGAFALGDEGGNSLSLVENATAKHPRHYYHSFHAYWDLDAVRNLVIGTPDELPKLQRDAVYQPAKEKLITNFVATEPKNWRTKGDPKTWAEQWANEILPIAREAHRRMKFKHVHWEEKDGRVFAKGEAHEIGTGYLDWSTEVVSEELHKAGWRLADLLQRLL